MRHTLLVLICTTSIPCFASGQTIRGRVTDSSTDMPVSLATIRLLGADSTIRATTQSDSLGGFVLRATGGGNHRLHIERIGYADLISQPMPLSLGGSYQIEVALAPSAVPVQPVVVKVEPRVPALERSGYYARKQAGQGHFIERNTIENRGGQLTSELFQGISGVVTRGKSGGGYFVLLRGGISAHNMLLRRSGDRADPFCHARVFVDGVSVNPPDVPYDFDILHRLDIEAIEIYRGPAQLPAQYSGAESACGVILVWRRVGTG